MRRKDNKYEMLINEKMQRTKWWERKERGKYIWKAKWKIVIEMRIMKGEKFFEFWIKVKVDMMGSDIMLDFLHQVGLEKPRVILTMNWTCKGHFGNLLHYILIG
jgi:hypothetical protein